jgi:hypothetical protein
VNSWIHDFVISFIQVFIKRNREIMKSRIHEFISSRFYFKKMQSWIHEFASSLFHLFRFFKRNREIMKSRIHEFAIALFHDFTLKNEIVNLWIHDFTISFIQVVKEKSWNYEFTTSRYKNLIFHSKNNEILKSWNHEFVNVKCHHRSFVICNV